MTQLTYGYQTLYNRAMYDPDIQAEFERLRHTLRQFKADILTWIIPLILGLYGLLIFKLF